MFLCKRCKRSRNNSSWIQDHPLFPAPPSLRTVLAENLQHDLNQSQVITNAASFWNIDFFISFRTRAPVVSTEAAANTHVHDSSRRFFSSILKLQVDSDRSLMNPWLYATRHDFYPVQFIVTITDFAPYRLHRPDLSAHPKPCSPPIPARRHASAHARAGMRLGIRGEHLPRASAMCMLNKRSKRPTARAGSACTSAPLVSAARGGCASAACTCAAA